MFHVKFKNLKFKFKTIFNMTNVKKFFNEFFNEFIILYDAKRTRNINDKIHYIDTNNLCKSEFISYDTQHPQ